ncbi:MAG: hypothetical protein Q8R35_02980 [bacterium]|nr:hypothetical protein [bacterium]
MAFQLRSDADAIAVVRHRYRDRGSWLRQPRYVVLVAAIVLAGAFLTAGGVSLRDFAQARGSDPELKRLEATHRGADLLIGEVRLVRSYLRQFISAAMGLEPARQSVIIDALNEYVALTDELPDALERVKRLGSGLGMVEDKMSRLRNAFGRLCRATRIPCSQLDQQPSNRFRSPGRGSLARLFLAEIQDWRIIFVFARTPKFLAV